MSLFLNDRVFAQDQVLRVLVLAADSAGISAATPVQVRVLDVDDKRQQLDFLPPPIASATIDAGVRFRGETAIRALAPGAYQVEAALENAAVRNVRFARSGFLVITVGRRNALLRDTLNEPLDVNTTYETGEMLMEAWRGAWRRVFLYLGSDVPKHVLFEVEPLVLEPREASRFLSSNAFDWLAFNLLRFAFDQLFYGGHVTIARVASDDALRFRLTLTSRGSELTRSLPPWLAPLPQSLDRSGLRVRFELKVNDRHNADLDMVWSPRQSAPGSLRR